MKFTTKLFLPICILILGIVLILSACQKDATNPDSTNASRKVSIYLTDDPCNFDSVFIDIRYVEIKLDTSNSRGDDHHGDNDDDGDDDHHHNDQYGKWDTLTIRQGVYNIMQLRNGVDTLLASGNIPPSAIRKIRITLGSNNRVVVGGVSNFLNLFNGSNNYVYIKIHKEDEDEDDNVASQTSIWLDFNVCESIRNIRGQYYLDPVLKPFCMSKFGKIEGKVLPNAAHAFVTAFNNVDSGSAMPESDGKYKIRGLKQGTYSIRFKGTGGYNDTTINNITIRNSEETHVPTITLHQ